MVSLWGGQKLVAVRFFPELAQHAIPLAMNGQIKYSREFNDYTCGYIDACGQRKNSRTWDGAWKSSTLS